MRSAERAASIASPPRRRGRRPPVAHGALHRPPPSRIVAASFLAALVALPLTAQDPSRAGTGSLRGRVVDAGTGAPLFEATIRLSGSDRSALTDEDGRFAIHELAPGARTIEIEWDDWISGPQRVKILASGATELRIALLMPELEAGEPRPAFDLPLLGVEIRGGRPPGKLREFFERMETTPGHFITRDDIVARAPLRTSDLLRQVPGVRPTRSDFGRPRPRIGRHSSCSVDLFLDGILSPGLALDDVPPGDIAGIEIYRGPSEVPIAFRRRTTCAAILIWTREPGGS